MSILLAVLGRGLDYELRDTLRPIYWQGLQQGTQPAYDLPAPGQDAWQQGLEHWRAERLDQAEAALQQACCSDHADPAIRAVLACVDDQRGRFTAAIQHLRALNRLCPDDARVQLAMGLIYEKLTQPDAAAMHYARAAMLDPSNLAARQRLAAIALRNDQTDRAIDQTIELIGLVPEDLRLRTSLAALLYRADNAAQACECYETLLAMEPENWALEPDDAAELIAQGQIRQAIDVAHRMIEEQGPFADLYVRLGNLYSMVGDDGPAVENYHQALDIQPDYIEATVKLATHHLLFGRLEQSAERFGQAAELNQWLAMNYVGLGVCQAALGQTDPAAASFDTASALSQTANLLQIQMTHLYWNLNESPEPMAFSLAAPAPTEHLRQWVATSGGPASRTHLAVLLLGRNEPRQALSELITAHRDDPLHTPAALHLGVKLKDVDRFAQAAKVLHRVVKLGCKEARASYELGLAFLQPGAIQAQLAGEIESGQPEPLARERIAQRLIAMTLQDGGAWQWQMLRRVHQLSA